LLAFSAQAASAVPKIIAVNVDGVVHPITAEIVAGAIAQAKQQNASLLLVRLNTPGGLMDAMEKTIQEMLASPVPVVAYVTPSGGRAASAGFFLLEAGDVAVMSPSTRTGAAHPVAMTGEMDSVMAQKVENDAAAGLRSLCLKRGRNAELAETTIRQSKSFTEREALDQHLIDIVSSQESELLQTLDGRVVTRFDGSKVTLHTAGARVQVLRPTLRDGLLGWLVNPNIALLLLFGGALLIYLEFNVPGTIVPGALGTLMVLLAIFALDLLPIRYTAVLLLIAALVLMLLEAKFGGHGALAIAGIVCLTFGMLTLVAAPVPEMGISPLVAIAISAAFGVITVLLVRIAVRARRRKARLGADALIGSRATAIEPLAPVGHILVEGEIWQAVASQPQPAGAPLMVVGKDHMLLRVEPLNVNQPAHTAV